MNASSWPPIESIVCAISLRRSRRRALEEHVLDEVRDAAFGVGLVARPARQPDADRHRTHVRHRLGDQPQSRRQRLGDDHRDTRAGPDPFDLR